MSLNPEPIGAIPAETVRVARAAFPKGTLITRLRDEFGALYRDETFRELYPTRGQPGLAPWRLALVTVFQSSRPSVTGRPPTPCAPASTGSTPSASS